ncbi:MAG: cupin domain-containing protein [Terracidiphilus sp.]|nr:cupin domain-containing protein [Terracidiphilus sp.]
MKNSSTNDSSRRNFLVGAPVAAVAGLALADALFASKASAQDLAAGKGEPFQFFEAAKLSADAKALEAAPGNNNLAKNANFTLVMTTEKAKSAKEYEWHAGRDHLLIVIDGETVYEVGGSPKGTHQTGPGEWLAPEAEGATKLTLKKGDILTIPRGTLHKRSTAGSVTFFLISPMGTVK